MENNETESDDSFNITWSETSKRNYFVSSSSWSSQLLNVEATGMEKYVSIVSSSIFKEYTLTCYFQNHIFKALGKYSRIGANLISGLMMFQKAGAKTEMTLFLAPARKHCKIDRTQRGWVFVIGERQSLKY